MLDRVMNHAPFIVTKSRFVSYKPRFVTSFRGIKRTGLAPTSQLFKK